MDSAKGLIVDQTHLVLVCGKKKLVKKHKLIETSVEELVNTTHL